MKKFFLILLLLILGCGGYIYYYFDKIVHDATEKYASEALGVPVKVDYVFFKIFDGRFTLKGIRIKNPKGFAAENIFTVNKIDVLVELKSIFKDVVEINYIKVEAPKLFYEIGPDGDNVKFLRSGKSKSSTDSANSKGKEKKIIIYKFFLNDTEVTAEAKNIAKKTIILPDIYIQNIGKDSNGITVENASDQILRELSKALSQVNMKLLLDELKNFPNNMDGLKDTLKEKREDIKEQLQEGISGFLKK